HEESLCHRHRRPPVPALFPYTTLFRSRRSAIAAASRAQRSSLARNTPGAARRPVSGPPSTKASRQSITLSAGRHARLASAIIARDRKSTRLNSSHDQISYAVLCLKKKI